jgi:cytosine permease
MAAETLGLSVPAWAVALFWGLVMTISAINGYRVLKFLYHIMTPVLFVVLVYTVIRMVFFSEAGSITTLLAWRPERPISYVTGITLVVGDWAMGAFVAGDFCRYGKSPRSTALGTSVGLMAGLPVVFMGGAILFILGGNADITAILSGMGFSAAALIFLILAAWALNMLNAYSGGIALSVLRGHGGNRLKLNTALVGSIGTVLGAAGILSRFTDFLSLLSSFVPPVIGVLMGVKIAGLLKRRGSVQGEAAIPGKPIGGGGGTLMNQGFHIPGIIAYGCGALAAWLTTAVIPFFITPLNGIIVAAVVYVILELIFKRRTAKADSPKGESV